MTHEEIRKRTTNIRWLGEAANDRDYHELSLTMAEGVADLLEIFQLWEKADRDELAKYLQAEQAENAKLRERLNKNREIEPGPSGLSANY